MLYQVFDPPPILAHFVGQPFEVDEWATAVFVKQEGKWLCVHSQMTAANKEWERR